MDAELLKLGCRANYSKDNITILQDDSDTFTLDIHGKITFYMVSRSEMLRLFKKFDTTKPKTQPAPKKGGI